MLRSDLLKMDLICMDESPKKLIGETKTPVSAASPGKFAKYVYEYKRYGGMQYFYGLRSFSRKTFGKLTETKKKIDWSH